MIWEPNTCIVKYFCVYTITQSRTGQHKQCMEEYKIYSDLQLISFSPKDWWVCDLFLGKSHSHQLQNFPDPQNKQVAILQNPHTYGILISCEVWILCEQCWILGLLC